MLIFDNIFKELTDVLDEISPHWAVTQSFDLMTRLRNVATYVDLCKVANGPTRHLIITKLSSNYTGEDDDLIVESIKESTLSNRRISRYYKNALVRDRGRVGCPVCLQDVTRENPRPLIVTNQCQHLFCLSCYYSYVKSSEQRSREQVIKLGCMPACPCCRTPTTISFDVNICGRLMREYL